MGYLIGESGSIANWGALRFPVGKCAEDRNVAAHKIVWHSGFRTTEGNGFFRTEALQLVAIYQPYVVFDDPTATFYLSNATTYVVLDQREADKLVGETVTLTGPDTFTITSDYLTGTGQTGISTTGSSPITAIGLLTAF